MDSARVEGDKLLTQVHNTLANQLTYQNISNAKKLLQMAQEKLLEAEMEVDVSNLHLISKIFTVKDEMTKETNTFVSEPNEEEYVLQAFVHVALCDFNALKTLRVRAYSRFNPSNKTL